MKKSDPKQPTPLLDWHRWHKYYPEKRRGPRHVQDIPTIWITPQTETTSERLMRRWFMEQSYKWTKYWNEARFPWTRRKR